MAELVVLNFKAAEGKFDALADMFRAVLDDTRAYDGCIKVDVYEDESSYPIIAGPRNPVIHLSCNRIVVGP